jgi:myo-inositol 2-dehydrogenase/D-chiro-inositol 1-dehydrogenase
VVAVGHNLRRHRLVKKAREAIASGALGELLAIRTVWTSPAREQPGWHHAPGMAGSVLLDIGVHHLDVAAHLGGALVASVCGSMVAPDRNRESAAYGGRLANGVLFSGFISKQGVYEHTIQVSGTRAALEFSCHRANSWRWTGPDHLGMKAQVAEAAQYARQLPEVVWSSRTGGDWLESYTATWGAFASAIAGEGQVSCTVAEGAAAVRAAFALEAGLR